MSYSHSCLRNNTCTACVKLISYELNRELWSQPVIVCCRKVREVTKSIQEFFSLSCELKYVGLSATKLPSQALRWVHSQQDNVTLLAADHK